jgi:preprotein translocase subunit SecE
MLGVQVPPGLPILQNGAGWSRVIRGCRMDKIKIVTEKIKQFLTGSKIELKKVTWPTPKQTLASTSVVIIVVIIVSTFLGIVDFGLTKIVKLILG